MESAERTCSWGIAVPVRDASAPNSVFQDSGLTGQASCSIGPWSPHVHLLVCCPPPHPSREAGCAGQLHEISHQPPLNLDQGIALCAHTHTHTLILSHTLIDSKSTRVENGVPTGAGAHDMQCRLPCHVLQHLHYPRAEHCA